MTALEAMGAGIAGKLLLLPLFAVGYLMYLILTSDRRKKTPQQQEPEPGTRQMTDGKRFNDIGFLSPDLVVWASQVRAEFDASFDVADRFNRLGMRLLFDIPTENIDDAKAMATAAYGRAIKSFQAALLLSQIGALAEARALVRVSTEAVILVGALKADPNVTDQMREDVAYHKCALFNSLLEGADGEKPDEEQAASFRAILDGIAQEYPDRKPKTMNWDSTARKAKLKRLYDMVYRLASRDAVHATLDSLQRHVLPDETKIQVGGFKYQPEKSDLSSTLFAANATMAFLLGIMVDWFPLSQYHDELRDCIARWKQTKSADYEWEE